MNKGVGSPMMLLDLLEAVRRAGHDPEPLLASAGLSLTEIQDPIAVLDNQCVLKVWESAPLVTGDDYIGFKAAEIYRVGHLHAGDYLVATAPSLRIGLEQWSRYSRVMSNLVFISVAEEGELAHVRLSEGIPMPVPRAESEYFLGCLATLIRHVVGIGSIFTEAAFPQPRSQSRAAATGWFGCNVIYDAPCMQLSLPGKFLDSRGAHADATLHDIVAKQAAAIIEQRSDHDVFHSKLRRLIIDRIQAIPSLEEAARFFAVSPRTMRRLLSAESVSYQQVVDDVRREATKRMLKDHHLTIEQVADRLGFKNRSAFGRAFRRWEGVSPADFRRQSSPVPGSEP